MTQVEIVSHLLAWRCATEFKWFCPGVIREAPFMALSASLKSPGCGGQPGILYMSFRAETTEQLPGKEVLSGLHGVDQ
jgi:hypothetical protein